MIKEIALKGASFNPFPAYADRQAWAALPDQVKDHYAAEARKLKGRSWPSLPAAVYMDFYRDGNRTRYEEIYFGRRLDLLNLLIAECIEGRGEFLDDIINGVWLVSEETSWVIPAHLKYNPASEKTAYPAPRRLPDPEDEIYIDLFAAETASVLSWVYYFLGDAIANIAPEVKRRMEEEVTRRILAPFLEHDDYSWSGLSHDEPVNNWNPWINSNVLAAYLVFAPVFPHAEKGLNKTIRSISRFIHFYAEDGGCDEGPNYFSVAGASLLDFVEELAHVSDVSYLYSEKKIQNMVSYIYKVYIGNNFYVNYADAPPRVLAATGTIYRAGKNMGNPDLAAFASYLDKNKLSFNDALSQRSFCVYRRLAAIFFDKEQNVEAPLKLPAFAWFPGIEAVTARDSSDAAKGFFFSAKGGHNNESHNHNDVGNFILYHDGNPVLVDAGVETYTKFTFSEKRYELWTMRSSYHNTPVLNGFDQLPGEEYRAGGIAVSGINGEPLSTDCPAPGVKFSLDIAGAYPASAKIKSYRREFIFVPGRYLELTDDYSFAECTEALILNLLCCERPEISGSTAELNSRIIMEFDSGAFSTEIEEIPLTDRKIKNDWQKDRLYRLRLLKKAKELSGQVVLKFTRKP